MMKKYFGKKEWSETLYLSDVFDESTIKKNGEIEIDEEKGKTRILHRNEIRLGQNNGIQGL